MNAEALLDADQALEDGSDLAALLADIKTTLGGAISDVRVSKRLVSSAVCLVAPGAGPDLALDRLLQKRQDGAGLKPVLEINAGHALVKAAGASFAAGRKDEVADLANLLLDQAKLLDGELPTEPAKFAERLNRFIVRGLGQG